MRPSHESHALDENKATSHGVSPRRKSLRSSWRGTGYTSRGGGTGRRRRSTKATTSAIAINASAIPMRTAMASMYRRPSRPPPSCKNPAVADTAEEPGATTSDVNPPQPAPVRVGAWPMWVLGLVVLIDQVDQNLVRGVVPQLKSDFGIDDFGIGVLISAFVLVNGIVTVPAGYLADRWNRTRTIGHTVVAWSGITMITAAAGNFATLLGLRALLGFGQAVTEPSAASLLSDYYPTEERGKVFSNQQIMGFS